MRAWGPPEQRRSAGERGGGWRLRLVAVAGRGAADRSVGSDLARARGPGSLAGLPRFFRAVTDGGRGCSPGPRAWGACVTRLLLLLGSRHTTRPAHAGVGGHHTTVSPLFFIAYPQTRVPAPSVLGPYAGLHPFLSTHCLTVLPRKSPHEIPKFTNPNPIIPRSQISRPRNPSLTLPSSTSRCPRRDMPQLEPKYNLKATIPSNSC